MSTGLYGHPRNHRFDPTIVLDGRRYLQLASASVVCRGTAGGEPIDNRRYRVLGTDEREHRAWIVFDFVLRSVSLGITMTQNSLCPHSSKSLGSGRLEHGSDWHAGPPDIKVRRGVLGAPCPRPLALSPFRH